MLNHVIILFFSFRVLLVTIIIICGCTAPAKSSNPVSLNVVSQNGFIGFAAQVQLSDDKTASGLGPQQLLVDTGSSALLFCNKDLAKSLTPIVYPGGSNVVLNPAGQSNDTCNGGSVLMGVAYGDNPNLYFWGYLYENELLISSADNSNTDSISGAAFAIAEAIGDLFVCEVAPGFDGIWGIAFSNAGNDAYVMLPNVDGNPSDVLCFSEPKCSSPTFNPVTEWCVNESTDTSSFPLQTVVQTWLDPHDQSISGIYLTTSVSNFTALVNNKAITYNAGIWFLGNNAIQNEYYQQNPLHATVSSNNNGAFWTVPITSMQVYCGSSSDSKNGGPLMSLGSTCNDGMCFLDSGTPKLAFPSSIVNEINSCQTEGSLEINMDGGTLSLNMMDLKTLAAENWIIDNESYDNQIILGFQTWLWYYIVFDYSDGVQGEAKLSFVYVNN
mmetsp:Transcript_27600/g.39493  ORF Transcript_27600/g.39493 Transcript_27600/m.39493 type:complete len:441 (-) Transcript_27600:1544-2866(-)